MEYWKKLYPAQLARTVGKAKLAWVELTLYHRNPGDWSFVTRRQDTSQVLFATSLPLKWSLGVKVCGSGETFLFGSGVE